MDYALVIDADDLIEYPPNTKNTIHDLLNKSNPNCCDILIKQETIDYWRGQIFKCNDGWRYVGVLHEYPSNNKPNNVKVQLPRDIFMISRRLGGRNLTGDKPKRDIEVLTQGLIDEPDNDRYVFYLAQSYKDNGDSLNAIKYYKKRFHMGRWAEEAWFSAYQVGMLYKQIGNIHKFEYWLQRAHDMRPWRAEPMYHLTQYFRINGKLHKAYQYYKIGSQIKYPYQDVLFVEKLPYNGGFAYEKTIIDYYVHDDKKIGLRDNFNYLLEYSEHIENVVSNLKFYVQPIKSLKIPLSITPIFGENFRPSAISVYDYPHVNIRFVNYLPPTTGEYKTKDGSTIKTKNVKYNLETNEYLIIADSIPLFESPVQGLEDMRLYKQDDKLFYTATNYYEYEKGKISIVHGIYGEEPILINSPTNSNCEKNWLHVPGTDKFIYNWYPLQIGSINGSNFTITKKINTPKLFNLFRGSALINHNSKLLALVHLCEYSKPRHYYHCLVELNQDTFDVIKVSTLFQFRGPGVEYCLSMRSLDDDTIECYTSFCDADLHKVQINLTLIEWNTI
jgi:tetratricopeptide (TPR) repeat protein